MDQWQVSGLFNAEVHSTDEECIQSIFLTEIVETTEEEWMTAHNSVELSRETQRRHRRRHTLERSTGGKYMKEVSTSKFRWSSIESPHHMNETRHWSGVRCVLNEFQDESQEPTIQDHITINKLFSACTLHDLFVLPFKQRSLPMVAFNTAKMFFRIKFKIRNGHLSA